MVNKIKKFEFVSYRKYTWHPFVIFFFLIILMFPLEYTKPESIPRIAWGVLFFLSILYLFWYKLSKQYIKIKGTIQLTRESIILERGRRSEAYNYNDLEKVKVEIFSYEGLEKGHAQTVTGHDGLGNYLKYKHNGVEYDYEFWLKNRRQYLYLKNFLDNNQDIGIKVEICNSQLH